MPVIDIRTIVRLCTRTLVREFFLTVMSTVLGFVPFMVGTGKEAFWFPLAAGTIGGLVMSVIGILIYLPVFTLKANRK